MHSNADLFYKLFQFVFSLETDNEVDSSQDPGFEYYQYFQGVDGRPGVDFPVYSFIPKTSFSCKGIETGYYADLETRCQVKHSKLTAPTIK